MTGVQTCALPICHVNTPYRGQPVHSCHFTPAGNCRVNETIRNDSVMDRLVSDCDVIYHLAAGQTLRVDTGCLVALQPSVGYDIQFVGKIKTALFGGEGLFFATLTGPGRAWLQSLPLSRMADRIYKAAPAASGGRREEGSILGGLGGLLDGDNR